MALQGNVQDAAKIIVLGLALTEAITFYALLMSFVAFFIG